MARPVGFGPGLRPDQRRARAESDEIGRCVAFVGLGASERARDGQAPGVRMRWRWRLQKFQECDAWYTYLPYSARSERFTVSRERPHSTSVESTSQMSSLWDGQARLR